jgi:two-component system NtrC family sensor kinase
VRLGIRLQILLLLGALLAIGFVPLYLAVARLTEASLTSARRDYARDLGRAVASQVLEARATRRAEDLSSLLEAQLSDAGVTAIAVYDGAGTQAVAAGSVANLPPSVTAQQESTRRVATARGSALLIVVPDHRGSGAVALTVSVGAPATGASALVQLVALYTAVVALALLFLAYVAMTRLVVRPVEDVSRAAGRVAAGARELDLGTPAARELADLTDSLREMTAKLLRDEQALRAKVEELELAKRELENAQESMVRSERLASVGRLAAGVAHEIGNPIAAILGFEELLLADDLPEGERRDFLLRMRSETERVNRVLRDLLDFARPPRALATDLPAYASAQEACDVVAGLLKPQKKLQGLSLETRFEAGLPEVAIGGERLQQVLLNLIMNAVDAAKSAIEVDVRRDGESVVISVADDGPGVAAEIRERLFEPFATTKEVGRGTGLGLAVCRGLVEAASGSIALRDSSLGGACFEVRLPARPEE